MNTDNNNDKINPKCFLRYPEYFDETQLIKDGIKKEEKRQDYIKLHRKIEAMRKLKEEPYVFYNPDTFFRKNQP